MSKRIVSEGVVCRAVIDRNEVMKNQIIVAVREALGPDVPDDQHVLVAKSIKKIVQLHTGGLVTEISNEFSKK
jgi:hypothetical protein|tara:strand:- start:650 stop:868 length:219 start_codon:yes stop_codon:yes gene_type:complete